MFFSHAIFSQLFTFKLCQIFFDGVLMNFLNGFLARSRSGLAVLQGLVAPTVWRYVFVADFEALHCQVTRKFIKRRNAETRTVSAIKYTACYALAVLVCPCD
jgi:hypothetical protein